jgi:C-terminal binding protein
MSWSATFQVCPCPNLRSFPDSKCSRDKTDYGTCDVADHALALTLSLRRGILIHHERQREPVIAPYAVIDTPLVSRLQGAVFGILGIGRIGTAAALRAKAFGYHVLFYDPYVPNGYDKSLGVERTRDIKEFFSRSSALSIHCACTSETRDMIGWELISLMPRGSVLVNTGRGEVMQLDAVERGLREGILAGAGLDVLPQEPIDEDNVHSLIQAYRRKEEWLQGRLVLTCHSAFYSPQSYVDIRLKSAQTMRDVLIDGGKSNVILPSML